MIALRACATSMRDVFLAALIWWPTGLSALVCFETFRFPWPRGKEPAGDARVEAIAAAARALVAARDAWLNPPGLAEAELRRRTLTNLYNERPAWLAEAHARLDAAVAAAYGWPADLPDEEALARLLALNILRSGNRAQTEALTTVGAEGIEEIEGAEGS